MPRPFASKVPRFIHFAVSNFELPDVTAIDLTQLADPFTQRYKVPGSVWTLRSGIVLWIGLVLL